MTYRESKVGKLCDGCYRAVMRGKMPFEIIGDCLKTPSGIEVRQSPLPMRKVLMKKLSFAKSLASVGLAAVCALGIVGCSEQTSDTPT